MKISCTKIFQIGLMFSFTSWYKGERYLILSIPFLDIEIKQTHKKYRK